MRYSERIVADRFTSIDYHHYTQGVSLQVALRVAGILSWPVVLPLVLVARLSDFMFRTCSEMLSIVPFCFGIIIRNEFYKWTLARFGKNVAIGFGTIFLYPDIEIGDNVFIGNYNVIHFCNFGSYVVTADQCQFLSGSKYHTHERTDIPIALQGGKFRRIQINDDCWIGANSIIMNDIGQGSIVGAGSVVTHPVEPYTIVAGNPANLIRRRK